MNAATTSAEDDAKARLEAVTRRLEAACERASRDPSEVTLVGVSKRHDAATVAAGARAGLARLGARFELGENFVQEVRDKQATVHGLLGRDGPELPRWRMIGRLQRNKASLAVRLFQAIDTVDREALARELDKRAAAADRSLDICLQVNVSGESQKGGVDPDEVSALLAACRELPSLRVRGLMTMPAANPDPEAARPAFARLRELRDSLWGEFADRDGHTLSVLSMGMSADFEVAIEEGATHVRVGTALFGPRPT